MLDRKITKELNEYLTESINLVEINHNSSLINTRKTLEYIVNSVYDREKIEKPVNEKGYTELSNLIDVLKKERKISTELAELMHKLRRNGNDAAHFNIKKPKKLTALNNIKLLCKVLVWFLKKHDMCENSLYLLSLRRARIKIKPKGNKTVYHLNESLTKLTGLSIFKNTNTIRKTIKGIPTKLLLDKELIDYIDCLSELVDKYYEDWKYFNYSEPFLKFVMRKLRGKKKFTPRECFLSLYRPRLDYLEEVKLTIEKRYLI